MCYYSLKRVNTDVSAYSASYIPLEVVSGFSDLQISLVFLHVRSVCSYITEVVVMCVL